MSPIEYIPRTRELYSAHEPYRWVRNEDAPWTPLTKPVSRCRVALASSAGIYHVGQSPFHTRDDTSIREIPKGAAVEDLRVVHFGYRTEDAKGDPNCVFPLERLRELERRGGNRRTCRPRLHLYGWDILGAAGEGGAFGTACETPDRSGGGPALYCSRLTDMSPVRGTGGQGG